jgi:hypothetical protein
MKRFAIALLFLALAVSAFAKKNKEQVTIEVVATTTSTTHGEVEGNGSIHGRKVTHTDAATMKVIINGEHAYMDCYEHHKGCTPIAPGLYNGELEGKKGGVWVEYNMPLTHKLMRQHYIVAGSW